MENNKNKVNLAYFNMVALAIEKSLMPKGSKDKEINRKFANSDLLKIWCDCSHNFEVNKLRRIILDKNI